MRQSQNPKTRCFRKKGMSESEQLPTSKENSLAEFSATTSDIKRFWKNVDKGSGQGCWWWLGCAFSGGYGSTFIGKRNRFAHRISFFIHGGVTTADKPNVLHSCHNKLCVNPTHLRAGNDKENVSDRVAANRSASGIKHGTHTHPEAFPKGADRPLAKITDEIVRRIRGDYATGEFSTRDLAAKYALGKSNVHAIVARRAWKHVL